MINLGTVRPGTTLYIPFATYDSNDPTASVTMTGLAVGDIEIYKDGGVTQRTSTSGYTLLDTDGTDFDGITGIHGISIDLSDAGTAGFYGAGSQYWVVLSSITVDAGTINGILATFTIGLPDAVLNTTVATLASQTSFTLTTGPAEDDALNGCVVYLHDAASAVQGGYAVVSDYTGSTKTVTLAAATTYTVSQTDNVSILPPTNVSAWNTVSLATTNPLPNAAADAAGGLPTSDAGGLDLDTLLGYLTAAVATATELAKVPKSDGTATWNATALGSINAEADTALSDFWTSPATLVDLVWDEVYTGHTTNQTFGKILKGIAEGWISAEGSVDDASATTTSFITDLTSARDDFYNDAVLVFITETTADTVKGVARPITSYTASTKVVTFDEAFPAAPANTDQFIVLNGHTHPVSEIVAGIVADPVIAELTTQGDTNESKLDIITTDTDELQTDWANGGRLDLILDAILAMLDDPRSEPAQGAPAVNADAMTKLDYLYKAWRNKTEQTATTLSIYDDAGTTVDHKSTISDDATTATRGEIVTGP